MTDINANLSLILEEIKRSKQELKSAIEAVEVRISLKLEETNRKLHHLEKENKLIINRIESLERKQRHNNIVIFGLHQRSNQITLTYIKEKIKQLVDINITDADINNFYPLGKGENRPVKVEFVSYLKKDLILKNKNKLTGSRIYITHDLTEKQRKESSILRKYLQQAKGERRENCYIKKKPTLHREPTLYSR